MKKKNFVKPAKLPKDAYNVSFQDSVAVLVKRTDKVFCECHTLNLYDPKKYKACFRCFEDNYECCKKREALNVG